MRLATATFGALISTSYVGYKFTQIVNNQQNTKTLPKELRREKFEDFVLKFQQEFVAELQKYETKKFFQDQWYREDGNGGGLSCIVQKGTFFEKAGVNTTKIEMPFSKNLANTMKERGKVYTDEEIKRCKLYANGVSLVVHPVNPFIPTIHANFRIMQLFDKETGLEVDSWFGGGSDLTPYYLDESEPIKFHGMFKSICDDVDKSLYPKLKKDCDNYFYIKHRKEHRGLGGIIWEDFQLDNDWNKTFDFVNKVAFGTKDIYMNIVKNKQYTKYNDKHVEWQQIRHGRYCEFNLVIDRGTKFGFNTPNARIESILMSLPLNCRWEYCYEIQKGSEEEKIMEYLKNAKDWV